MLTIPKAILDLYYGKLENSIFPALLGIDDDEDHLRKIDEIEFVETQTGKILHKLTPHDEKV